MALRSTSGPNQETTLVGNASLQKNFDNEELKAFNAITPRITTTYAKAARGQDLPGGDNLVLDESQSIRNPNTKTFRNLRKERKDYSKALLLTATPMYNEPADLASQVNLVADYKVLPTDKKEFYSTYYKDKKVSPGILARLMGVKPGTVRELDRPKLLRQAVKPYVHIETDAKYKHLKPKSTEETVYIPMSKKQKKIYKYISKDVPFSVKFKVKRNLPVSKTELGDLNAFLSGLRQVSNTTAPFVKDKTKANSPKMDKMINDLKTELSINKTNKVLTYSNFIEAGVGRYSQRLKNQGIPHSYLVGSMSKKERREQVNLYNKGQNRVMLYSGAGSEGINLPKTSLVQLMEPHWNEARLDQAKARGIRRGDDPNKVVKIKKYVTTFKNRDKQSSAGQYLMDMSARKQREINNTLEAIK